jgi:hypothetical protein
MVRPGWGRLRPRSTVMRRRRLCATIERFRGVRALRQSRLPSGESATKKPGLRVWRCETPRIRPCCRRPASRTLNVQIDQAAPLAVPPTGSCRSAGGPFLCFSVGELIGRARALQREGLSQRCALGDLARVPRDADAVSAGSAVGQTQLYSTTLRRPSRASRVPELLLGAPGAVVGRLSRILTPAPR